MSTHKNGILVRFPFAHKKGKKSSYVVSFYDFILNKISDGDSLGYKCFVFELTDDDFSILDFYTEQKIKDDLLSYINNNVRIAIYIKSKKYLTSDSEEDVNQAFIQIKKCLDFINSFHFFGPQQFPIILHIGGAKGDRRGTMDDFCKRIESLLTSDEIQYISVVNDEKPSLFSVKDLLSGVFYKNKIPIVFRSTSYPTNQGNLTLNESLLLAASTWKRTVNPLFIYLPGKVQLEEGQARPFGLELDVVFDNRLPEP